MHDNEVDMNRLVLARLPFWLVEMAKEIGSKGVPRGTVGDVFVRIAGKPMQREHAKLPKLQPAKAQG